MTRTLRDARQADLPAIAAIHDAAIRDTIAVFRTQPLSPSERQAWFDGHSEAHPLRVCEIDGAVVGFVGLHAYDGGLCGYAGTDWLSIYVAQGQRGRGIGRALMADIIAEAEARGLRHLVSRIALPNPASVGLHRAVGFREVGVMRGIGRKFGRDVDVLHLQYALPARPATEDPCNG